MTAPTATIRIARARASRRGLSLLELLLAMTITVMVAAAIAGMLGAVSSGVGNRRDSRTVMLLANAGESRLSAYLAPARCVLSASDSEVVLWLNDARESGTVHATELRWLRFDAESRTINVSFVLFPAAWTQPAKDLQDKEYAANTNWDAVLAEYQAGGWVDSRTILDNVSAVDLKMDQAAAADSRQFEFNLTVDTDTMAVPVTVSATIRLHAKPVK